MGVLRVDGKTLAAAIEQNVAGLTFDNRELVGFAVEGDTAGISFQERKQAAAARCGIRYRLIRLPDSVAQEDFESAVSEAAAPPEVGGIVVQLPLPPHVSADAVLDCIPAEKDPDVLGGAGKARSLSGNWVLPPAARAAELVLEAADWHAAGLVAAVVGQGRLIGQPVSAWLRQSGAEVRELDRGFDESALRDTDLVVLGTGSYRLDPTILKAGSGVIDFGYQDGRGDLETGDTALLAHLAFYTPTPGGTGPVLVAALLENFARLNA